MCDRPGDGRRYTDKSLLGSFGPSASKQKVALTTGGKRSFAAVANL